MFMGQKPKNLSKRHVKHHVPNATLANLEIMLAVAAVSRLQGVVQVLEIGCRQPYS